MSEPTTPESAQQREPRDLDAAIRELILAKDRRFAIGAYHFLYESLAYTQKKLRRDEASLTAQQRHVTGQELIAGIRDYAAEMFGPLSPTVFRSWGLSRTEDFGEIVFNLVEQGLLGKTDADKREDFAGGFDFDTAFEGTSEIVPK